MCTRGACTPMPCGGCADCKPCWACKGEGLRRRRGETQTVVCTECAGDGYSLADQEAMRQEVMRLVEGR